jgi:hypothetical protein
MRVWHFIVLCIVIGTGIPLYFHYSEHGVINHIHCAVTFFLWLNIIICLWEICLFFKIDHIAEQYKKYQEAYTGREMELTGKFFNMKLTLSNFLSPVLWSEVWSIYAMFDESYADKKSFGFTADVGNGTVTLIPSILLLIGMTYPILPAQVLGILGLLVFYQMIYCTTVYYAAYMFNKRYKKLSWPARIIIVGGTNCFWILIPLVGFYASVIMVLENSFSIFL